MEYYLMNKDTKVLSFKTESSFGETVVNELKRFSTRMPIGFTNIELWLRNRNYAKHKDSLRAYLKEWGMDTIDGFINVTNCLGLNDTLWVKASDSNLVWKDVSLYSNSFTDVMEVTAFGNALNNIEISSTDLTSPEFVSPGSFAKCWRREGNDIYLYKTQGSLSQGLEPFSEYFASQIASSLGSYSVDYALTLFKDKICTRCRLFTSEKVGLIPFAGYFDITKTNYNISNVIKACESLGLGEEIKKMYLLDSLILNQDRHLGNIGFLFDNDSYEIIGLSPIYDLNISMLCNAYPEDMQSIDSIDKYIAINNIGHQSGAPFYDVGVGLELDIPKDISISQHPELKMDDKRFEILQDYIQLNHERIKRKDPDYRRHYYFVEESLADVLDKVNANVDSKGLHILLSKQDFDKIDYLANFKSKYPLEEGEHIYIDITKDNNVECILEDEFGPSILGNEILGNIPRLLEYAHLMIKENPTDTKKEPSPARDKDSLGYNKKLSNTINMRFFAP